MLCLRLEQGILKIIVIMRKENERIIFKPDRVYFEKEALEYPLGQDLYQRFSGNNKVDIKIVDKNNTVRWLPGDNPRERFLAAKRTLVVGLRRTLKFAGCRPSAHYQLPLGSSCPGLCTYCYLHTTLGKTPTLRLYVNLEEILQVAKNYLEKRLPEDTTFEGSATSDPLALEHLSGALVKTINFFAGLDNGWFRFATKQTAVAPLLDISHNGKTRIRFSINVPYVEQKFERGVPPVSERIKAALAVRQKGYPVGFLIAPIFIFPGWQEQYSELLYSVYNHWKDYTGSNTVSVEGSDPSFELITHRFTTRGKKNIMELFPENTLPLDQEERRFKFGQFGYGKYIYHKPVFTEVKEKLVPLIEQLFEKGKVDYLV